MTKTDEMLMREALLEAERAALAGEVPVGAVVVYQGEIIARAHNEIEQRCDATAHAEILAIQRASAKLSNWRLNQASIFVTLEPCTMCFGAMILARISKLHFGCSDPRQGAVGSLFNLSTFPKYPCTIEVFPHLLATESKEQLQQFFKSRR